MPRARMVGLFVYRLRRAGELSPGTVARIKSDLFAESNRPTGKATDLAALFDAFVFSGRDGEDALVRSWERQTGRTISAFEFETIVPHRRERIGIPAQPEGVLLRRLMPDEAAPRDDDIVQDAEP